MIAEYRYSSAFSTSMNAVLGLTSLCHCEVSREFIVRIKCDTSNVHVVVLWKQPRFKQTSETVSAKRLITQIIAQWVPGSCANSKCPTPIRAETASRLTHGTTRRICRTNLTFRRPWVLSDSVANVLKWLCKFCLDYTWYSGSLGTVMMYFCDMATCWWECAADGLGLPYGVNSIILTSTVFSRSYFVLRRPTVLCLSVCETVTVTLLWG